MTPMGEESENESEAEGEAAAQRGSLESPIRTQSGDQQREQARQEQGGNERIRIFQYLKVQEQNVKLPERRPGDNRLALYLEIDDTILHTFIYDENFGFMSDPNARDPEYELEFGEKRIPIKVYMRDCAQEFLDFLRASKDKIEPIVYTSGVAQYTDMLLNLIDPKREIFEHRLYQPACYVFEKKDEKIFYMIKDISRFKTQRDMKRSVILDPNPLNFMLSPENGLPLVGYNAEMHTPGQERDEYLIAVTQIVKELAELDDVRPYLRDSYNVRQVLKNAKLL